MYILCFNSWISNTFQMWPNSYFLNVLIKARHTYLFQKFWKLRQTWLLSTIVVQGLSNLYNPHIDLHLFWKQVFPVWFSPFLLSEHCPSPNPPTPILHAASSANAVESEPLNWCFNFHFLQCGTFCVNFISAQNP